MTSNLRLPASGALLLLATHLGLIFVPAHSVRLACATLFVFLLPGFGWVSGIWVRRGVASRLELLLLNSGLSLTLSTLTGLVFHLCGAPFTEVSFFGVLDAISLAGLLFCGLRARLSENRPWLSLPSTRTVLSLLLLLFVTCSLRLTNLGYAEFQGDEIRVLAPAQSVVLGERGVLFAQKKGPVQTLLAASFALTTHGFHEGDMRFPFAVASSLAVLALYLIGREVFGPRIGLIAGLILSIEGLALAFSRVVQYQAIVLLMVTLSILCFYRISDGQKGRDPRPYLALGTLFFAMGLLAHYDTVFALPALGYLYYRRYGLALPRKQIGVTVLALVAAGTLLAVFYVPFLLQPQFQDTYSGYTQGKLQPGLYNNLDRYVEISGFYNSVYYVGFLCLMLILGSWEFGYRSLRSHRLAHLPGLSLGIGLLVCILWPTVLRTSRVELGLLFVVPLLITLLLRAPGLGDRKALWVWFFVPFTVYMFVLKAPGLHYYSLSPAWALMGALGLEALFQKVNRSSLRWVSLVMAVLAFALCAYYPVLIFVRHDVRYALTFPQNQSPLYWTWQKERPDMPFFGFPHKAGWKAIGVLFQTGLLRGSYATNEKLVRESWYIPATRAEGEMPRYVFYSVDSAGYKDIPAYRPEQIETFYSLAGQVTVEGVPRLLVYGRAEEVSGPPATYRAEDYEARHDDPALLDNLRTRPMSPLQDQDDVQQ